MHCYVKNLPKLIVFQVVSESKMMPLTSVLVTVGTVYLILIIIAYVLSVLKAIRDRRDTQLRIRARKRGLILEDSFAYRASKDRPLRANIIIIHDGVREERLKKGQRPIEMTSVITRASVSNYQDMFINTRPSTQVDTISLVSSMIDQAIHDEPEPDDLKVPSTVWKCGSELILDTLKSGFLVVPDSAGQSSTDQPMHEKANTVDRDVAVSKSSPQQLEATCL